MLDLLGPDVLRDPHPLYAQLRDASPLVHHPGLGIYALFDYAGVRRALSDHESFGSAVAGGQPGRWLIFLDPPRHGHLRALVSRAFTARAVAELEPRVRAISSRLLDAHRERGAMELVGDYAVPLPLMVIAEMLGAPVEDHPRLRRWSDAMLGLADTIRGGEAAARAEREFGAADREMSAYLAELSAERRASPRDDLLSRLLSAEVEGARLADDEILAFFQLLLLAGHETTTNLIANAVLSVLEHPSAAELVARAPERVVEEVLRYRSPVQAVFRMTKTDVTLHGTTVPAGRLVLAFIGSANRALPQLEDPERFDPTREPSTNLAFGHGIHFCLGAQLARLEARVALPELVRLRGLARAGDEPWPPRPAFHVHGPASLPVRFEASSS